MVGMGLRQGNEKNQMYFDEFKEVTLSGESYCDTAAIVII